MAHREGVVVDRRKPDQTHLRAYGCKAYAMTTAAQKKQKRLQRLNPKAWIGFLIGYNHQISTGFGSQQRIRLLTLGM